jgi:hypothetical protein
MEETSMLKRPLWFVTEKGTKHAEPGPRRDTFAFSTFDRLAAFMAQSRAGAWDVVEATNRDGLITVIADAHMRGCDAVYLDPDSHGKGGECVFLTNLISIE